MRPVVPDLNYYRAIHGSVDCRNIKEVKQNIVKDRLKQDFLESINCEYDAKRNGKPQKFIVTKTDRETAMDIHAFPDEDLQVGDMIDCYDQKWIVTDMYATNTLHYSGLMEQCNHLFRFQNGTSDIYEYWGVLDSGVYSTTEKYTDYIIYPDQQFKVFLPYNEHTMKMYEGKRLATEMVYNNEGLPELVCFTITAIVTETYHYRQGKLLELKLRSDKYRPEKDNVELGICDYIAPNSIDPSATGGWL